MIKDMTLTYISQKNYRGNSFAFMCREMTWKPREILHFHLNFSNSSRNQPRAAMTVGNTLSRKQPTGGNADMKNSHENEFV